MILLILFFEAVSIISFRWTPDSLLDSQRELLRSQPENEDQNQQNMRIFFRKKNKQFRIYIVFLSYCFTKTMCFFLQYMQYHRKNSQIFAGRWIGLIIANYIVNRWKQTLINTNWKITSLHHPDLFTGLVVWASDILLRSENTEEHMNMHQTMRNEPRQISFKIGIQSDDQPATFGI